MLNPTCPLQWTIVTRHKVNMVNSFYILYLQQCPSIYISSYSPGPIQVAGLLSVSAGIIFHVRTIFILAQINQGFNLLQSLSHLRDLNDIMCISSEDSICSFCLAVTSLSSPQTFVFQAEFFPLPEMRKSRWRNCCRSSPPGHQTVGGGYGIWQELDGELW